MIRDMMDGNCKECPMGGEEKKPDASHSEKKHDEETVRITDSVRRKVHEVKIQVEDTVDKFVRASPTQRQVLVYGMSFTVGASDVVSLILYDAFGTMMTGNTIYFAQSLGTLNFVDAVFYASLIASFCFGQFLFKYTDWKLKRKQSATRLAPLILVFTVAQDILHPFGKRWVLTLFSSSLGIVTSVSNDYDGVVCNMVTGHMQRLTNLAFEFFYISKNNKQVLPPQTTRASAKSSLYVIVFFFLGVATGTIIASLTNYHKNKQFPIFSILGAAFSMLMLLHDRHVAKLRAQDAPRLIHSFSRRFLDNIVYGFQSITSPRNKTTTPARRTHSNNSYFIEQTPLPLEPTLTLHRDQGIQQPESPFKPISLVSREDMRPEYDLADPPSITEQQNDIISSPVVILIE